MSDTPDRKTLPTPADADAYIASVSNERRRGDAQAVLQLMRQVSGVEPQMWGSSIVGFGRQPYRTADGKDREWFAMGLSPRKASLTLYGLTYYGTNEDLLAELGPHSLGKGCLYIRSLAAVNLDVLTTLMERAWRDNHVAD